MNAWLRQSSVLQVVALTAILELLTLVLRFGLALESTRDTASTIGVITCGVRVHHGYCGLLILVISWSLSQVSPRWSRCGMVAGWALLLSDAIHHFLILWPLTGDPQFHLLYPPN